MVSYVICQSRKIMTDIKFKELGKVEYTETYDAMMELIASQPSFHSVWSLEHFPVFTIGISEKEIAEDKSKSPPFIKNFSPKLLFKYLSGHISFGIDP